MQSVRFRLSPWLLAATILVVAPRPAHAQIASAELTGEVSDQAGAAVAGATVTVTDVATNRERAAATTADGLYRIAGLAPGTYRADIALAGFKSIRRDGIRVATGEKTRLD
ncbi:MAG: carboxypeptidase regulatory-like domain-containing protein, partial [Gemmatimonadetes bacterium]|nr:carboxypeptidase regulatory-like domain-containing protein [Gemmatimonadota bacterium]